MGPTDMMRQVIAETTRVVDGITPDQLDNPTGCTEWSVRDVLNHITGGSIMFAECVEDGAISDERLGELLGGDNLGDDYKSAFRNASQQAIAAFAIPDVLDKPVTLPFGQMPAGVALQIAVFDVTTHACDLAKATGQEVKDQQVLDAALEAGHQMIGPDMRGTGLFNEAVQCSSDASPMDKLLAFAGRGV